MGRPGPPAAATGTTRLVATGQIKRSVAVVIDDALWRQVSEEENIIGHRRDDDDRTPRKTLLWGPYTRSTAFIWIVIIDR
jgi:hypothetical protein